MYSVYLMLLLALLTADWALARNLLKVDVFVQKVSKKRMIKYGKWSGFYLGQCTFSGGKQFSLED